MTPILMPFSQFHNARLLTESILLQGICTVKGIIPTNSLDAYTVAVYYCGMAKVTVQGFQCERCSHIWFHDAGRAQRQPKVQLAVLE